MIDTNCGQLIVVFGGIGNSLRQPHAVAYAGQSSAPEDDKKASCAHHEPKPCTPGRGYEASYHLPPRAHGLTCGRERQNTSVQYAERPTQKGAQCLNFGNIDHPTGPRIATIQGS
jgi:hypothetical protein